jgi:hypothetical protein
LTLIDDSERGKITQLALSIGPSTVMVAKVVFTEGFLMADSPIATYSIIFEHCLRHGKPGARIL